MRKFVICRWYDCSTDRYRVTVGYIGEDGIKDKTWYRADSEGKLVEVGPVENTESK